MPYISDEEYARLKQAAGQPAQPAMAADSRQFDAQQLTPAAGQMQQAYQQQTMGPQAAPGVQDFAGRMLGAARSQGQGMTWHPAQGAGGGYFRAPTGTPESMQQVAYAAEARRLAPQPAQQQQAQHGAADPNAQPGQDEARRRALESAMAGAIR